MKRLLMLCGAIAMAGLGACGSTNPTAPGARIFPPTGGPTATPTPLTRPLILVDSTRHDWVSDSGFHPLPPRGTITLGATAKP